MHSQSDTRNFIRGPKVKLQAILCGVEECPSVWINTFLLRSMGLLDADQWDYSIIERLFNQRSSGNRRYRDLSDYDPQYPELVYESD
ncbi:MAG: hypothetical protein JW801_19415 [Bacteroidales bacterium]|nr:hypothetical protein [Bacteroidales bacterium]